MKQNSKPNILDLERVLTHVHAKIMSALIEKIYY